MQCIQVKRAQAHLLEHLYAAVTTLGGAEAEYLLEEESESIVKREKLKQVSRSPPRSALYRAWLSCSRHLCLADVGTQGDVQRKEHVAAHGISC